MTQHSKLPAGRAPRGDRRVTEYEHDTYKSKGKLKEPTACPQCGAVYEKGRWTWNPKPSDAHEALCPACHRIADHCPKGLVTITGAFLTEHRDEILGIAHNEEKREKGQHPLARLMRIDPQDNGVVLSTTDTHLARRIGEAIHHAYQGDLNFHYDEGEDFIRVSWMR